MGRAIEEGIKRVSLELQTMESEGRHAEGASMEPSDVVDVSVPVMGSVSNDATVSLAKSLLIKRVSPNPLSLKLPLAVFSLEDLDPVSEDSVPEEDFPDFGTLSSE